MKRIILYPFNFHSEGYSLLRDTLRKQLGEDAVLGVKPDGIYKPKTTDLIVGWGYSKPPIWEAKALHAKSKWLNMPNRIGHAVNKEDAFARFIVAGVTIPAYTTSAALAALWVSKEMPVVQRTKLTSSKGKGASVAHIPQEFDPHAKLFTKLIDKTREFRVHVFAGKVIDVHEKLFKGKKSGNPDWEICSCEDEADDSKWTWQRSGVVLPVAARNESIKAVAALGLDFGGVDVVTNATGTAFVLEVNTAPWLGTINVKYYAKELISVAS